MATGGALGRCFCFEMEAALSRDRPSSSIPAAAVSLQERGGASDEALAELIRGIWTRRADRYSELRASLPHGTGEPRKVEMFYIGG